MNIEEFEEEVRQAYIANGWQSANTYWFNIDYTSQYKHKQIRITRIYDDSVIYEYGENFSECFANVLKMLKTVSTYTKTERKKMTFGYWLIHIKGICIEELTEEKQDGYYNEYSNTVE